MAAKTRATWTKTTFEIAMGDPGETRADDVFTRHETVEGETWGPFGVNADRGPWGTDWIVTHLPTGLRMVTTESKLAAKRFCLEVADLTDWTTVTAGAGCPPEIREAVVTAYHRAHGAMVTDRAATPAAARP